MAEGPVRGSGFEWYRVFPMGEADLQYHPDPPREGWVAAAGKDGARWIADWGGSCQTPLDTVSDFDYPPQGLIGLSCFGDRNVTLTAMAAQWDIDCDGSMDQDLEPSWFRVCDHRYVLDAEGGFPPWERAPLYVVIAPEARVDLDQSTTTEDWVRVRVTGHYDDPRARDCTRPAGFGLSGDVAQERAIRDCRSRFVVTRLVS